MRLIRWAVYAWLGSGVLYAVIRLWDHKHHAIR